MIRKTAFIIMIILLFNGACAFADTQEISDNIDIKLNEIHIDGFDLADFKNEIILNGKIPTADTLLGKLMEIVFDEAYLSFKNLIMLIVPIMLFGVLSSLSLKKSADGVASVAYMSCYMVICTSIIYVFADVAKLAKETILNIDIITKCMIPVLYSLMLTLGRIVSTVSMQPTIIFISQIMLVIVNKLLLPLIMLSFSLIITDNVANQSKLKYFSDLINKFVKWVLVFILSIFTAILSTQNILGHSFDKIALKGTKFAVTNFIPIIGGALSEGVETVGASLILIKNATGISGIAGVVVIALLPIIKIYLVSIMFYILSAISQPVTGDKFSKVLSSVGSATSTLGVLVICMAFVFVISVAFVLGGTA